MSASWFLARQFFSAHVCEQALLLAGKCSIASRWTAVTADWGTWTVLSCFSMLFGAFCVFALLMMIEWLRRFREEDK